MRIVVDREAAVAIPADSVAVRPNASREAAPTGTVALDASRRTGAIKVSEESWRPGRNDEEHGCGSGRW